MINIHLIEKKKSPREKFRFDIKWKKNVRMLKLLIIHFDTGIDYRCKKLSMGRWFQLAFVYHVYTGEAYYT